MILVHNGCQPALILMLWSHRRVGIAWKHQKTNLSLISEDGHTERSTNVTQDIIPLYLDRRPYDRIVADSFDNMGSPRSNQFANTVDGSLPSEADTSNGFSPVLSDAVDQTNHDLNTSLCIGDKEIRDQDKYD